MTQKQWIVVAAAMIVVADSGKVFPGALRVTGHEVLATMLVLGLAVAVLCAEHGTASALRNGGNWRCPAVAFIIAFVLTMALAAVGADKALGDVILLRVMDRESVAIWAALLSAKLLPLALLIGA